MHKILQRQIDRHLESIKDELLAKKQFVDFLSAIEKTYGDYEKEYALIERSLNISSKELTEVNERIREEASQTRTRADELERFNKLMIDRELKMVELKEENRRLKELLPPGYDKKQ